jgi:hypothetical protein
LDESARDLLTVMFVDVIAAKVGIGAVVLEKVIDNDQDGMRHGYRRLLGASTSGKTPELRSQVGVLCPHCSMGGFDQSHAHPRIPAPDAAAFCLPALSLLPGQMPAQEAR